MVGRCVANAVNHIRTEATAVEHKYDKLPDFTTWLRRQYERQDAVGALARRVCNDPAWPRMQRFSSFLGYIDGELGVLYDEEDLDALYKAWEECVLATRGKRAWLSWKISKMWDCCPVCRNVFVTPQRHIKCIDAGNASIVLIYRCHHCFQTWRYIWPMKTFEQFNVAKDAPVNAHAK